jgi:UDP-glucose 4-epimerase
MGGTANLLEAAAGAGTQKVVVGLDAVAFYGQVARSELPVKEGTSGAALSAIGVAHRAVADLLGLYRERRNVEFSALTLGSVYGTRQRPTGGVVAAFLAARRAGHTAEIHGDGRQTRDFVAVDDAVDAVVRATTRGTGLVVNVGTGVQTSINDVHSVVLGTPASTARHGPARPGEVGRFALSPVRARIHLAWAPWTDFATGIADLLATTAAEDAAASPAADPAAGAAALEPVDDERP